ncbi:antitoxin Xre/MbcA/ParS toxin-binding domain-containing protein [Corallincola platygyrae]|uniref:Antitoxin Xre/MbcA/ParS toxin-binding domain-containing protein n=1 Tax=Corallincola platygyrae TaxID=1193278 RepID=A0ABW4XKS9_9GAMM
MSAIANASPDHVLAKAVKNAAKQLGLSQSDLSTVIGKDRSAISRSGISIESKPGQLSALLIRCYRSLYALMGGDVANMQHFMNTPNHMLSATPAEAIKNVQGLVQVTEFLDAMRGRG